MKGIKELDPDEAQKAIQRASGGLLEAAGPVTAPVLAPTALERTPKPSALTDEGK